MPYLQGELCLVCIRLRHQPCGGEFLIRVAPLSSLYPGDQPGACPYKQFNKRNTCPHACTHTDMHRRDQCVPYTLGKTIYLRCHSNREPYLIQGHTRTDRSISQPVDSLVCRRFSNILIDSPKDGIGNLLFAV